MEPPKPLAAQSPVEATIRILLSGVPHLIGAAVVRQPAGPDAVAADVGRNPWLFDRRLTSLDLPDDALPANRALALDWPVPYQAEWVGVPPRLLISRLVFAGRTVGVLLGTLVSREQLDAQVREAIDLSCEVIASAVAMDSPALYVAPEPEIRLPQIVVGAQAASVSETGTDVPAPAGAPAPSAAEALAPAPAGSEAPAVAVRSLVIVEEVARAVAHCGDARGIGRILRDAVNAVTAVSAFAVTLFHAERPEVAYRYKVGGVDEASRELGRQPVDDGPTCDAVRGDDRWRAFDRTVTVGGEPRPAAVLQVPLRDGDAPLGVVTVQTFRDRGFAEPELELIAAIVDAARAGLAQARAAGRFQPAAEPPPAPSESAPAGDGPGAVAAAHQALAR